MRWLIRVFVVLLILCMALDAMPWNVLPYESPKQAVSTLVNKAGIWQGQWSMFTPTPSVNNLWISADLEGEQSTEYWSSPFWSEESDWNKFVEFRSLNFFNRLNLPRNRVASQDFGAYLLRTFDRPENRLQRVVVFGNGENLITPEQGEIMPAEELVYSLSSQTFAVVDSQASGKVQDGNDAP